MSNDLISRSALMESIKKWLPSDPCGKEQSIEEVVGTDLSVSMLMEIEEAPTAYDVDVVCEEIQKQSDNASDNIMTDTEHELYWNGRKDGLGEALEIVRNGGKKA